MGGFFNLDGPFYKFGTMLADVMILSLLWIVCSIPLFTIGASTSALFYVTTRRISDKEGYLLRDFFKSFRVNFIQATLTWLLIVLIVSVIVFNIVNIKIMGNLRNVMLPLQICFLVEISFVAIYIFPIIARFELKFKEAIKSAFFMANKHIFTSIACLATAAVLISLGIVSPLFSLIAIGVYAFLTSYMFMRVFKKYRPEIDSDDQYENMHTPNQN